MLSTDCKTVKIPLSTPDFNLMFLSMESRTETKSALKAVSETFHHNVSGETLSQVIRNSSISVKELGERAAEHFFSNLAHCNLSEIETAFCQRAQTVFCISAVRNSTSFFAPFWACQAVVQDLAQKVESVVIDMHQGNIVTTDGDIGERDAFGIPLTAKYLTVKGYAKDEVPNRYFLCTEGMSRFGLPELNLPEVPSNLLNDGAYLLRAVAQFLWTKLKNIHPEQPHLEIENEAEMSSVFCEYGNPAFHADQQISIPFALSLFDSAHESVIVVKNPDNYDDYYDWFLSVNESILELRLAIQRQQAENEITPHNPSPVTIAA